LIMFLSLGEPSQPTVVHSLIKSNPIAASAGIKAGDQVVSIDNTKVVSPDDAVHYLVQHKATPVHVNVIRDSKPLTIDMTTNADGKVGMALVSKGPMSYTPVQGNFFQIAALSGEKLWTLTGNMLDALGQMASGLFQQHHNAGGEPSLGI